MGGSEIDIYLFILSTNGERWTLDNRKAGSFWRRFNVSVHAIFLSRNVQCIAHDVVNRTLNGRSVLG